MKVIESSTNRTGSGNRPEMTQLNSILHGFTPEQLAILITDAVVGGNFKTKGQARARVEELLKVFLKVGIGGKELTRRKHQRVVDIENSARVWWQRKMKELHPESIEAMYQELEAHLVEKGLREPLTAPATDTGR